MGKPPGLSIGEYKSPNIDHEQDMVEHGTNPRVAKVVYVVIVITLVALVALVGIGLHIPTGG